MASDFPCSLCTNLCLFPGKWKILRPAHQSGNSKVITCVSPAHCVALVITTTECIPISSRETARFHLHLILCMFYCNGNGTQPWNAVGLLGTTTHTTSVNPHQLLQLKSHILTPCLKSSICLIFGIYIHSKISPVIGLDRPRRFLGS